jgi:hypothetical protein
MEALALLTKKNSTAGVVMMMLLGRMNGDSVYISITNLHECTGIDKGNLRRAVRFLLSENYIDEDPEMSGFFVINPRLVPTEERPVFSYPRMKNRMNAFPRLSPPKVTKRVYTEVQRMNEMTDEDIANAVLS